ncbi:MAG: amidohydrolase family protein [Gammaproteobacteria bacterium]|nr:amidohydrolase family protein [Gammaproteobacteria bacterium]
MPGTDVKRRTGAPFGQDAPYCAAPDPELRVPAQLMGPLSCDCHAHICGPESRYAYAEQRIYTPPDALVPGYRTLLSVLGVERAVLVQPSVYGTDNTVLLQAMKDMQRLGVDCRGVAVLDETVPEHYLDELHALGIRGLRFNLVDVAEATAGPPLDAIRRLCRRIARLGWHAEFLIHVDDYPDLDEWFADFPVEIVVGHMGYCRVGCTVNSPGFAALLRLARDGRCWVKLTGPYRISAGDLPYTEAADFAGAVVEAAPTRAIWGTDWPHVMVTKAMPNDADLCDLLNEWVAESTFRQRILVGNPAVLYGFAASENADG